ncbi:hypothetical protein IFM89_025405 [Coptis chinensis]|uniref:Uncharacterized protein n=1 Tax=Coptis chinensis TaxID=261450 RepID=A0A835H5A9_9MAGN|nr:hypothetical protein IFM89_025405 [Coptis chinensis]
MVLIMNFIRSLVAGFLFTLLVLGDSHAHTQQAVETIMVVNGGLALNGENDVSADQELLDGVPALTISRNKKLGGRKMVMDVALTKRNNNQRCSAKWSNFKDFRNNLKSQKSAIYHSGSSQPGKSVSRSDEALHETTEYRKLLEETIDIVNLMHMDYTGNGNCKRMPPINNYIPTDKDNVKP